VAREVEQVLGQNPGARVWFGPRMQWGYPAFGRPSPVGQPSWWHPGVSFPASKEADYVENWLGQEFELLIFLGRDATYLSPALLAEISKRYTRVPGDTAVTVLQLKPKR
jgi:hypothetical protein